MKPHLPYRIIKPRQVTVPVLAHIPHSAMFIPDDIRKQLLLSEDDLNRELIRMTDAWTEEIFSGVTDTGGVAFVNGLSRLVFDPERFLDISSEPMEDKGMGVVYTRTSDGRALRDSSNPIMRQYLIERYYAPYHEALNREVRALVAAFGFCILIDGHSFPSRPLPYETDQNVSRPDICIGTDSRHTPRSLRDSACSFFKDKGYIVETNRPFSGSLVPSEFYGSDTRVQSVMIECNRRLYMNELTGNQSQTFEKLRQDIALYLRCIAEEIHSKAL